MIRFLLISFFVMMFSFQAYAFELLMFNNKHCIYCKKFLKEVGLEYNISNLPLIIIDDNNQPKWFDTAYKEKRIKPLRATPVFIVWNEFEKYEVDRIIGYGDKDRFYNQLNEIFVKFLNQSDLNS